jgi:hypothetical protein
MSTIDLEEKPSNEKRTTSNEKLKSTKLKSLSFHNRATFSQKFLETDLVQINRTLTNHLSEKSSALESLIDAIIQNDLVFIRQKLIEPGDEFFLEIVNVQDKYVRNCRLFLAENIDHIIFENI